MSCIRISALNLDISWKNKSENFRNIELDFQHVNADLFLLPEMFATGFCMDAEEIADRNDETLNWMKKFAASMDAAVGGSVSVFDNGSFKNRFYFVEPNGNTTFYDKRHLFSFSGEDEIYSPGNKRVVIEFRGVRFLLQVCYDLRFPVFSRSNDDYDTILYVANWPEKRVEAWEYLLKARALENLSYVVGLNRIGTDGNNLYYPESSYCFFADGSEISEKSGNIVSAEIDLERLRKFRKHFQFLNDRDSFKIDL